MLFFIISTTLYQYSFNSPLVKYTYFKYPFHDIQPNLKESHLRMFSQSLSVYKENK